MFDLVFLIISLFLFVCIMISELNYVQLDGYLFFSYTKNLGRRIGHCWYYFVIKFLLVLLCFLVFRYEIILLGNILVDMFYLIFNFKKMIKIKFTHRMIRLFLLCLFFVFVYLLCTYFFWNTLFVGFSFLNFIFTYVVICFSLLVLRPFEKCIGNKYITRAIDKILSYKNLIKIGITGSFGKTSTKVILKSVLSTTYYVVATPKSFNTPFGLSKTILSDCNSSHEVFIAEMGAKKRGEIAELCDMVLPDCGIVTSVGRQHMESFLNVNNIYLTKKELPDSLTNKMCVFNLNNSYVYQMYRDFVGTKIGVFVCTIRNKKSNKLIKNIVDNLKLSNYHSTAYKYYEFIKTNNYYAKNIALSINGVVFDAYYSKQFLCTIRSSLIGIHNVTNILLAVAMSKYLGVDNQNIVQGVENLKSISARLEKNYNKNGAIILNNGYNSNLDSVKFALSTLDLIDRPNKIVVTPGFIDCKDSYEFNYKLGALLAHKCTDVVIVKKLNKKAIFNGLRDSGFDMNQIRFVQNFSMLQGYIDSLGSDSVLLIENDLPDNFV